MRNIMNKRQIEKFRKMLRQIQRELMELFKNDAQCCGISMAQCHTMIGLSISGKTNISILADELGLDKSTLSRTIDGLVQQGLVLRNIKDDDRRFMAIELSDKGNKFNKFLNDKYNMIFKEALEDIPAESQAQLLEAMELFITILNRIK
jgi:DNA-binding MarR family transcriptional regulator